MIRLTVLLAARVAVRQGVLLGLAARALWDKEIPAVPRREHSLFAAAVVAGRGNLVEWRGLAARVVAVDQLPSREVL